MPAPWCRWSTGPGRTAASGTGTTASGNSAAGAASGVGARFPMPVRHQRAMRVGGGIMARQRFGWQALAIAVALGTVGLGIGAAGAQSLVPGSADDEGLLYQRRLDLSLNPTRIEEAPPSVADTEDGAFVERSMNALV